MHFLFCVSLVSLFPWEFGEVDKLKMQVGWDHGYHRKAWDFGWKGHTEWTRRGRTGNRDAYLVSSGVGWIWGTHSVSASSLRGNACFRGEGRPWIPHLLPTHLSTVAGAALCCVWYEAHNSGPGVLNLGFQPQFCSSYSMLWAQINDYHCVCFPICKR